jgi:hypothetical protein
VSPANRAARPAAGLEIVENPYVVDDPVKLLTLRAH